MIEIFKTDLDGNILDPEDYVKGRRLAAGVLDYVFERFNLQEHPLAQAGKRLMIELEQELKKHEKDTPQ